MSVASYQSRTAVVIGASLAGMLSAHVAARRFERVIVVDRGDPPDGMQPRRSVPQERHVHLLLQRGKRVLEALFPGFLAELERHGAVVADASRDIQLFHYGRWKRRFDTGITTHYCSRNLIDHVVRERLRRDPKIAFETNTRVTGLVRGDRGAICGITTESRGAGRTLDADLVIDAGGRGSQAAHWLAALGLPTVRISEVTSRLGYGTRLYRKRPEYDAAWKVLLVLPRPPRSRRMGVISPIEGDRWMVTTGGWLGECPDHHEPGFLEFLRGLPDPAIYDVVRGAEPLSEISIYRIPGGLRRHYEEIAEWPARLLVIGDAVCSLNPIYSQGMTVSALEVEALSHGLDELIARGASAEASRDVQRRIAAQVDGPWQMAESEDLRFPQVAGARSWRLRAQHAYGALVAEASAVDPIVARNLLGVIHLIESPERLRAPGFRARVLASAVRARLTA
jgi:2-polyprenyl-6-methoxyphenol hydroxylase-like FAD-dependent oxidoreductase